MPDFRRYLIATLLSAAAVLGSYFWQGRTGFQLSDEGSLWYGAQRVVAGEIPVRDFFSYDPARYFWSAGFMGISGDTGILALRQAVAVFQFIGLAVGIGLLGRGKDQPASVGWLILATVSIGIWMFPRHKLFDASIALGLIALLTLVAERPGLRRCLGAGFGIGLAAFFGRNHGVYGVTGAGIVLAYHTLATRSLAFIWRPLGAGVAGLVLGYLPMLVMMLVTPRFARAVWEGVHYVLVAKSTNLALPVPWPWLVAFNQLTAAEATRAVLVGLTFILSLAFGLFGLGRIAWGAWRRRPLPPALLACFALSLPYAHYAYSRADIGHLALGIFPLVIGSFVLAADRSHPGLRWSCGVMIAGLSLFIMLPMHPGWRRQTEPQWTKIPIGGDLLAVDRWTAQNVALVQDLARRYASNSGDPFLVIPYWPGAYALLERRSPLWEINLLLPRSEEFQRREIKELEATSPRFVLLVDVPTDGREELLFRNTHATLAKYLRENYRSDEKLSWAPYYFVLVPSNAE